MPATIFDVNKFERSTVRLNKAIVATVKFIRIDDGDTDWLKEIVMRELTIASDEYRDCAYAAAALLKTLPNQ